VDLPRTSSEEATPQHRMVDMPTATSAETADAFYGHWERAEPRSLVNRQDGPSRPRMQGGGRSPEGGGKVRSCIRRDLGSPKRCEYIHAIELVSEVANHQAQQIYFGIAAIDGHDADLVCIF
jgi:hypothetical protein